MILPKFEYRRPRDISGAIALFKTFRGKARYLAGGTDLVPLLKLRLATPAALIDLKGIPDLKKISRRNGWFVTGANVTLMDLKKNPAISEYFPALYDSLDATSCETLQMRGTIGGNILQETRCLLYDKSLQWRSARGLCFKMGAESCNVVPGAASCFSNYCSDNAPSLISLSAKVTLVGPDGERTVKLEEIYSGNGRRPFLLGDGEILTDIRIPMKRTKGAYEKLRVRGSMDYPLAGVAVSLKGTAARVCVGGVGPAPRLYRLSSTGDGTWKEAAKKASADAKPVRNTTLSPAYRKKMIAVLFKRALARALQEKNA